jgi:ribosome recycling factor
MTQEMRQEIIKLASELPDELLAETLAFLHSLAEKAQKTRADRSSTTEESEFNKVMAAYQTISKKYKNALRELA